MEYNFLLVITPKPMYLAGRCYFVCIQEILILLCRISPMYRLSYFTPASGFNKLQGQGDANVYPYKATV